MSGRTLRLPGSVAEIGAAPRGRRVAACFDLDGTLIAGYSIRYLGQERLRNRELNLSDAQKQFMRAEIQKTTTRFNELQWQLQDAVEALHQTLKANPVNEEQALAQLDKVLDAEREIKRLHIGMGIRIKNQLTPEQQAKLMAMHQMMMGPDGEGRGPGPRHGPGGPGGPMGSGEPGPRPGGQPRPGGPGSPGGGPPIF